MKAETLKQLQAADDALRCDGPEDCDWEEIEERVRRLKPELEKFLRVTLLMEGSIQDASFVAGLYEAERVVCVRFSAWGNFFTVWDESLEDPLATDDFEPIVTLIEKHGFSHVGYSDLWEVYEGDNEHYKKESWSRFHSGQVQKVRASWWERYFDYV